MQPDRSLVKNAFVLGLLGLVTIAGLNYEPLMNEYFLSTYKPTAQLQSFESRISLTQLAKATLYRADPRYDSKTAFNADCDTRPHELELGCYYRGRIFVLQIDNQSLAPEMDVVAAHELLHAVWAKMSGTERERLTADLEQAYAGINDQDLRDRMAGYAKSEPGEEANELHSILGTEYRSLPPRLEEHYAKYFPARDQVVAAHAAYQQVFDTRRTELESELAAIRAQKGRLSVINRQLESYRAAGQIAAYNSLVPQQNRLVDDINSRIASYRTAVDEYNALSKSLDSQQITDTETSAQ